MRIRTYIVKLLPLLLGLVLAGTLVNGHAAAINPTPDGSSPTFNSCKTKFDGNRYDLSTSKGKTGFNNFQNDACNADNGGYCVATAQQEVNNSGQKITIQIINCAKSNQPGSSGSSDCTDTSKKACSITDPALASGGCTGSHCSFIDAYVNPAIKLLSALVGVVAVIFIIFGAIQVSTSGGDPQKSANGKNHIRNALIGLVAYVLLFALLNFLVPGGIG